MGIYTKYYNNFKGAIIPHAGEEYAGAARRLIFKNLNNKNIMKNDQIFELKTFVLDNLDKYLKFNLNQNSLINAINSKINHA